jgi:hypothetical protein
MTIRGHAILLLLALSLAGCAADLGAACYGIVVQNKFAPDDCAQLTSKTKATEERRDKLEALSRKARQDVGGGLVASTVYGPDLAVANADLRLLQKARIDKKCDQAGAAPAGR